MTDELDRTEGTAAGVPFVALAPPAQLRATAPVLVAWHLLDPPRTHTALAAALPLHGLPAWRIYLGLPMTGPRLPAGGLDELKRLALADCVLNLHQPITSAAVAELPGALEVLRTRLGFDTKRLAFLGGSLGAVVAQLALLETNMDVQAVVLLNPSIQLRAGIDAFGQRYGMTYPWSPSSLAVARKLDFVARSEEFAARGSPTVLMVVGEDDLYDGIRLPAQRLRDALRARYADPQAVALETVPRVGHALAEEPGTDPAPPTAGARAVERLVVPWLRRHLCV